jgi:hypothetical protein
LRQAIGRSASVFIREHRTWERHARSLKELALSLT